MRILVLSNGKGEDSIAATFLPFLENSFKEKTSALSIQVFPLVGDGDAYLKAGYKLAGFALKLPSHGFGGTSFISFIKDLAAGLIPGTFKQIRALKELSKQADLLLCIGDIYPVAISYFFTDKPIIHIATAVSVRYRKYGLFELGMFKRRCRAVFSRDKETAEFLTAKGVQAKYFGNLMMDDSNLKVKGVDFGIDKRKKVVAFLPSSRPDADNNIARFLKVATNIRNPERFVFMISASSSLKLNELRDKVLEVGWIFEPLKSNVLSEAGRIVSRLGHKARLFFGNFGDLVSVADVVVGSTGTGTEQAAGLGKPLVILRASGAHTSNTRIRMYSKLLSKAVLIPEGNDRYIAEQITHLVNDQDRMKKMSEEGKRAMGESGAGEKIAEELYKICQSA
jgi:uncharacterized protein (TIGR03492 family)